MNVVTHQCACPRIDAEVIRWKHPLPPPRGGLASPELLLERVGEGRAAMPFPQILAVKRPNSPQVLLHRRYHGLRQGGVAVLSSLALAHAELTSCEVQVLDPKPEALAEPEPASVQHRRDESMPPVERIKDRPNLLDR